MRNKLNKWLKKNHLPQKNGAEIGCPHPSVAIFLRALLFYSSFAFDDGVVRFLPFVQEFIPKGGRYPEEKLRFRLKIEMETHDGMR